MDNEKDFEALTTAYQRPADVNQLGEAMTRLLSPRLESIAELRKGTGERAVKTLRLQAGPGARVH